MRIPSLYRRQVKSHFRSFRDIEVELSRVPASKMSSGCRPTHHFPETLPSHMSTGTRAPPGNTSQPRTPGEDHRDRRREPSSVLGYVDPGRGHHGKGHLSQHVEGRSDHAIFADVIALPRSTASA